jgi:LSD1 subclass zinc finger protein
VHRNRGASGGPTVGHLTMPITTQCPQCRTVLNLPDGAVGRRLRCPKCGTKFSSDQPGARPPSSAPGVAEAGAASSILASSPQAPRDVDRPLAEGDLRETFDLPMMMEEDTAPPPSSWRSKTTADPLALFQDDEPTSRRRSGAEMRAQSRPCPNCGSSVPPGMSLCTFCGLDLETGMRVGLEDDFDIAPAAARGPSMPMGISVIGGIAFLGSVILVVISLFEWLNHKAGFQFLALVCLFGIFASVQFLRGKSSKLLIVALTLGAMIDVVALIALPVYHANEESGLQHPAVVTNTDDEIEGPLIKPYTERLDYTSITWGITILLVYAATTVYLMSSPVRRHFERAHQAALTHIQI